MVRSLPALGRSVRLHATLLGEVALAGVLTVALAFASSDGTPNPAVVDPVMSTPAFVPAPLLGFHWFGAAVGGRPPLNLPVPQWPTSPPATILIPSLNVHRPVEQVGLDRFGTLNIPKNLWNAGWFNGGPTPGAPGDAVIEGHAGYPDQPLLFARIGQLKVGAQITVVLADGSRRLFVVDSSATWPALIVPPGLGDPTGQPRLTLITCNGSFNDQTKTYSNRLVVEAHYAGLATT